MGVGRGWWFSILSEGQFRQFTLIVRCRRNSTGPRRKSVIFGIKLVLPKGLTKVMVEFD